MISVKGLNHSFKIGKKGKEKRVPVLKRIDIRRGGWRNCIHRRKKWFGKIDTSTYNGGFFDAG